MLVAVSGATGQQGGATVDALLRLGGFKVRGLTRDPSSTASKELAGKGVEVVKADFDDVESLKSAFQGADAVFAVTDFWKACGLDPYKEIQQGKNLVDAAKSTGGGMGPNKQPDGSFILALPTGDAKISWCGTADIGNVAAAVIAAGPQKFGGKTVPVAGDHLTWAEVGETMAKVVTVTPPADAWVQQLVGYGVPELVAKDLANMCIFYEKVGMLGLRSIKETKAVYPGVLTLEAWLTKHKEILDKGMA
ncbi:hypothetical protein N2152v2_002211 [Parachlorella kessleri]